MSRRGATPGRRAGLRVGPARGRASGALQGSQAPATSRRGVEKETLKRPLQLARLMEGPEPAGPDPSRPPSSGPPRRPAPQPGQPRTVQRPPQFKPSGPTPAPGPLEQAPPKPRRERPATLLTILAVVLALGLALATVAAVREDLTAGEKAILTVVVTIVAAGGLVPMRWGWYVMAVVTLAFFGLNLYNQLNPGGTIFVTYQGSSYTFAAILPAVGILVGAAAQAIYRFVGGR